MWVQYGSLDVRRLLKHNCFRSRLDITSCSIPIICCYGFWCWRGSHGSQWWYWQRNHHHVPQCSSINGCPCMIMRSQPLVVILVLSARCMECWRGLAMRILSVRPSVCHTRQLWQNSKKSCTDFYTIQRSFSLVIVRKRMVGGGRPLVPEILSQLATVGANSPILNR